MSLIYFLIFISKTIPFQYFQKMVNIFRTCIYGVHNAQQRKIIVQKNISANISQYCIITSLCIEKCLSIFVAITWKFCFVSFCITIRIIQIYQDYALQKCISHYHQQMQYSTSSHTHTSSWISTKIISS